MEPAVTPEECYHERAFRDPGDDGCAAAICMPATGVGWWRSFRKLLAALSACLDLLHIQVEPAPARQARRAHSRQEHEGRRHCVGPSAVRPAEVWYNADETYQIVIRFMRNVALGLQLLPRPVTTI